MPLLLLTHFAAGPPVAPAHIPLSQRSVLELLGGDCPDHAVAAELRRRGASAFPDYERILNDKDAGTAAVITIFSFVSGVNGDRVRFRDHAVRALSHKDHSVRLAAISLLAVIGTPREAKHIVPHLDEGINGDAAVQVLGYVAAETLAAIGGKDELKAMNEWLDNHTGAGIHHFRARLEKHRDALKKRLDSGK